MRHTERMTKFDLRRPESLSHDEADRMTEISPKYFAGHLSREITFGQKLYAQGRVYLVIRSHRDGCIWRYEAKDMDEAAPGPLLHEDLTHLFE